MFSLHEASFLLLFYNDRLRFMLTSTAQLFVWSLFKKLSKDFSVFAGAKWKNKVTIRNTRSADFAAILILTNPAKLHGYMRLFSEGCSGADDPECSYLILFADHFPKVYIFHFLDLSTFWKKNDIPLQLHFFFQFIVFKVQVYHLSACY